MARLYVRLSVRPSARNGCIVVMAKQCEMGPRLLLITNRKLHYWLSNDIKKSLTLDDPENQHCNRNCIDCNASSLVTAGLSCLICTASSFQWQFVRLCIFSSLV